MKILAEYDGKKCYIFNVYYSMSAGSDLCAVVMEGGKVIAVKFEDLKVIDTNYEIN